ncbi:uncharacterized protein [Penaeus vannamei]|uniref:uncharacterized protein isoform X1 n=1 Tax=Penaeus vannamei TaxID=6689 RepID=UPI00387F734B
METLLRLALSLSLLVCVLTSSEDRSFRARGVDFQVDEERQVRVWAGNGTEIHYTALGRRDKVPNTTNPSWHNFTAKRNDSHYCFQPGTEAEVCDKTKRQVHIESSSETEWIIKPSSSYSGCDQYHLLELQLDVHETPTKLFWRPGKFTRNLSLNISTGCVAKYEIAQSSSQSWFDITFQRVSGGNLSVVNSALLNISQTCQGIQRQISRIEVTSLIDSSRTPSYFSFHCGDGQGTQPDALPLSISLSALALFLLVALAAVVGCLLRAKVLPCTRETLASNPKNSDWRGIPRGQEPQEERVYEYVSLNGSSFQDVDEEALELPSLTAHDSENSLYGEF